jgi:DNA (cytosine-5)-methyltransferase 1
LPSWTIQAQPGSAIGPFHWDNRKLTPQEMCRLQTFPDGISFDCGRTEIQRMIGNAVPSLLAEVLAREIRTQLLDQTFTGQPLLMPPVRSPVPPTAPLAKLPSKYLPLIADHADHPGQGRKRGAAGKDEVGEAA